jgi:LysM repeat protein
MRRRPWRAGASAAVLASVLLAVAPPAAAFTHVVMPGDTLASIAERYYGRIQKERLLVAANFLDARAGNACDEYRQSTSGLVS